MVFWRLGEPFLDPIELRETEDTCIYISVVLVIQAITSIYVLADQL